LGLKGFVVVVVVVVVVSTSFHIRKPMFSSAAVLYVLQTLQR
jgi:hypothetical protein